MEYFVFVISGTILILTDLHYDPTYLTSQESCNKPQDDASKNPFGDVECDAPWPLIESAISALKEIKADPELIFWIG